MKNKLLIPFFSIGILVFCGALFSTITIFDQFSLKITEITTVFQSYYSLLVIPLITVLNVLSRYIRWTFLLRSFNVLTASRELFLAYLSGFVGNVFPLYLPYIIRIIPIRNYIGLGIALLLLDLFFDIIAIAALLLISSWISIVIIVVIFCILCSMISFIPSKDRGSSAIIVVMLSLIIAAFYSFFIWLVTSLSLKILIFDVQGSIDFFASIHFFANSQLKGVLSLVPAGITTTGMTLINSLQSVGFSLSDASWIVVVYRLLTFWLTIGISIAAIIAYRRFSNKKNSAITHFDLIAKSYKNEIPDHIRMHLLKKKIGINKQVLSTRNATVGLDVGCGQGWYMKEMIDSGYSITGFDYSFSQITHARSYIQSATPAHLFQGSVTTCGIKDNIFDFIYAINIIHHLPTREDQKKTFAELYRILKPGGVLIVHEMNVKNIFFRFYMSYIFPLIKNIDEGTEIWIKGDEKSLYSQFVEKMIVYKTFLPDFLPECIHTFFAPLENVLENHFFFNRFSAHITLVLEKKE